MSISEDEQLDVVADEIRACGERFSACKVDISKKTRSIPWSEL
jgi:hypothetical protein